MHFPRKVMKLKLSMIEFSSFRLRALRAHRRISYETSKIRGVDGHIPLAHTLWSQVIHGGDTVIDATCGNGGDSVILGNLALTKDSGMLYCLDVQSRAINETRDKLMTAHSSSFEAGRIKFILGSHENFPSEISAGSVSAIVYNLGYLPGTHEDGANRITTTADGTIRSLEKALPLLKTGGILTATLYLGHPEGPKEALACFDFFAALGQTNWRVFAHKPINTLKGPILVTVARR